MERFTDQVNIQPVSTRSGQPQAIMSLVERLEQFKNVMYQGAARHAVQVGAEKAGKVVLEKDEKGVTKSPEFKKNSFIGGIERQAYNEALKGAYLASLNRDIRSGVSEIKAKNFNDIGAFNTEIEGLRNTTLRNIDPAVRSDAENLFEDVVTSAQISVQTETIQKNRNIAKFELENSANLILEDALTYSNNGDFYNASRGLFDYNNALIQQMKAGFISESEAKEKSRQAGINLTTENMVGDIRRLTQVDDFKGAVDHISSARDTIPEGMSPDEHQKMLGEMIRELNQGLALKDKLDEGQHEALKTSQSVNYSDLSIGIATGTMGLSDAVRFLRNKKITESQFDKAVTTLNTRGQGVNDHVLVNQINDAIADFGEGGQIMTPEMIQAAIISNMGTSLNDATAGEMLTRLNQYRDPDFILNTSNVKRAKSFITPMLRVIGIAGAFDTEAERRLAEAQRKFDERVISGEDPWFVADELIGKDRIIRKPKPMFGSKTDLKTAREKLDDAAKRGEINKATYNYERGLIDELEQLIETQKAFDEARKNANANAIR